MGKVIKGQSKNDAWNDDDIPVIAAPSKQDSWSDDDIPVISATPQKKSPDPFAGGLPVSSTPGQNGSPTSDVPQKQIVELPTAPDPLTGLPTEAMTPVATPQEKTEQATKYIANHYLQNVGAPQGMQVNAPEHPLNQLTDPHGDPSYLSSYVKSNLARLQQKQTANVGASENMGGVPEYLQSINQEREDLLNNAGQIMRQQLFAKEVQQKKYDDHSAAIQIDVLQKQQGADIKDIDAQIEATNKWEHPNGVGAMQERSRLQDKKKSIQEHYGQQMQSVRENTKYNPIMIGAEYAANMGNPQAEKDLEALRQGRSINPASQYAYNQFGNKVIQDGTDAAVNDKAKQEGEEHADRSGNQLYENNKSYIIQQAANTIGNAKYEDTNPLMNAVRMVIPSQILPGASKDDIQKYGEENGLDQKVIDELKKDPSQIPKQASLLQQFGRGLFNAAAPIYETGVRTAGHVFGGNAEAINEAFTPGWENQRGVGAVIAGNTPTDQNSFHNVTGAIGQIFEGAGNLATFAGEVGGTAKGLEGLGMTEKGAEKLANFGVMTLQGYNDSYKHSLELFGDKPEDEGKRQAFSLINGIIGGAIFSHTPKYQPIKDALGKVSKSGEQLIEEMQANGGTDFLETKVGKDKLTAYVQKFGSEMGTQVKLATAQKISEGIVTTLAAPDAKQDIPEDVKNTAISTMLTMLIPSILGAKGHVDMQSPLNHAAMFEMGSNPDKYINFIGQQLRDGKITPEQAQMSHDAILKMKNVIANTPTTTIDKEGNTVPLSPDQIKAYSYSLFQEDLQQKKLEDLQKSATTANLPVDKAQEAPLKKKISELQKQRDEILAKPAPAIIAPNQERSVATDAQPEGQAFAVKEKLDDDFYKFYQEYYQPHRSLDEIKEGWYDSHKMSPEEWSEDHKDFYNQPHSEKSENWPKLHSEVNKLHQRYKDLKKSSETEIPEEGSVIKWDRYGNEEENDWTVGKRVKTRGGQEAVELSREYEDGGGKSTVTHVVTLEDLQKKSSEKEGNSENKNIPLSPQVGSQQKTPQDEKTNGESGQNEAGHQGAPNESRKEAGIQGNDDDQAGQERGRQGRPLNETEEGNKAEATPTEQPIPVSGRKRRKLVAEEEPVQQKEYAAMDIGTEAGKPVEEVDKKVKAAADDEKIGGGESFNEFKDRIQKSWENTKKTAEDKTQFIMHSTAMRLIEAGERVGWDSPKLREEFNKEKEPEAATKRTYDLDINKGKIDLYRHAETEDGKSGLTRTPETPLTEKGKGEAKEIAADIKDNGIAPPAIVAGGDEVRTGHTAEIVANEINQGTEPSTERRNEVKPEPQAPATKIFTRKDIKTSSDYKKITKDFKKGDKITFHTDGKERTGIWDGTKIRDEKNNPWGVTAILSDEKDWIRNDGQEKAEGDKRSQKKKEVAARKRHKMDYSTYNANKKFVEESGFEPTTAEEHVLMHMADGGKFRMGTEEVPGMEKHLPTRKGTEEYEATKRKWLADHDAGKEVYDKLLKKNVPVADADKMLYDAGIDDTQNQANVAEIISQHNTQGEVYQRLADIIREKQKIEAGPEEPLISIKIRDIDGNEQEILLDPHSPTIEADIAKIMGAPDEDAPEAFTDEGHPIFKEGQEQDEAIRNADMTQDEKDLLDNIWDKHTLDNGKLNVSKFVDELQENRDKFGKDVQNIIDKLLPFNTDAENEPHIKELRKKIEDYERANSQGANEETPTEPKDNGSPSNGKPGEPKEGGGQEPAATPAGDKEVGEKPNQVPETNGAIATDDAKKNEGLDKKLSPNELVRKKQIRLNQLQGEHDDLISQKEKMESKIATAQATAKPNENAIEEMNSQLSEINKQIKDKQTSIKLKEREIEIQKGYANSADNMRKGLNKLIKDSDPDIHTSGLNKQLFKDLLSHAIDLYERFGNIHIAALKGVEWAKGQFAGEKGIDDLKEKNIRDLLSPFIQPLKDEPIIRNPEHLQVAKEMLVDIENGDLTHEEARQDILESEGVSDRTKGNVLNWIDWHLEGRGDRDWETKESEKGQYSGEDDETSIKNDTTRLKREQFGLNEELQAGHKEFGETWNEAKEKIEKGDNPQTLVDDLARHPRPITDVENAMLLHHQVTLENRYRDINNNINEAADKGDRAAILENKIRKAALLDQLQKLYDVNKAVGTENARGLASRRMASDRKYTLVNMLSEKRATANDGQPLSEEQQAHVEELHKKIQETQEAFDAYQKQKEQDIIKLQRQVLVSRQEKATEGSSAGKSPKGQSEIEKAQLKSKTVADKLRKWADNFDKKNKGNAYSSIIPITPKMVSDAVRLVAAGVEKGGELLDHIQKSIAKIRDANPGIDETHLEREINQAVIDAGIVPPSEDKGSRVKTAQFMSSFFKNGKLDREAVRLNVAANKAKGEFETELKQDQQKKLSTVEKAQNTFIKWQRAFKLSNPLTIGKLATAGFVRLASTPLEDVVGGAYSAILPQLAKGAIGEGGGLNVHETASAYTSGLMMGIQDFKEIMKKRSGGKSELDTFYGKGGDLPPEALDFFGKLHSATKAPFKRVIFERSLAKRLRRNIANGVDVSDPMVQTSILVGAYKDANRAIFMQDNKVADFWTNTIVKGAEKHFGKGTATALNFLVPFVKIPANIVAETGTHIYGLPKGVWQIGQAFRKGMENIPDEKKEVIMRNLKKGTIGIAAMVLGYYNPQNFGGYYQAGEKRDEGDAEAMGLKWFGVKLPAWLSESPLFQAIQFGSTVRRLADKYVDGERQGELQGVLTSLLDVAQESPLANQPIRLGSVFHSKGEFKYYMGELAKSTVDPALITYLAKATDPADEGSWARKALDPQNKRKSPKTILDHIKSGIPFLREDLDEE